MSASVVRETRGSTGLGPARQDMAEALQTTHPAPPGNRTQPAFLRAKSTIKSRSACTPSMGMAL